MKPRGKLHVVALNYLPTFIRFPFSAACPAFHVVAPIDQRFCDGAAYILARRGACDYMGDPNTASEWGDYDYDSRGFSLGLDQESNILIIYT